ncbi:uncharacterized protein FIBRA_05413 [Fibroporia radiculosa]|uniref:Uncharacterized protein n=1 Tax=Fibroporia radiculosa TaxID=599839 RepID=J4GQY7_9APHY|nr:uncharacterized protein FIBRA_05413 [Fibroporia radiculosa]CCM03285.1 predicted protein [Fibroporia radiculosa]
MLAWWVVPIYSYSGSHLLLSVRALAAERQRLEMMIPQISETISDFEAAELSNMGFQEDSWEVYELSTPPRDPTACLHRDGVVLRTQRRSGSWMQHWDARPARSMTAY